jgi:hypothetical protein
MSAIDEINWNEITEIYDDGIPRLLQYAAPAPEINIVLWSDSNGGFNFDIYQKFEDGSQKRLGDLDGDWGAGFDHPNERFEAVSDQLADDDDFDSLDLALRIRLRAAAEKSDMIRAAPDGVESVRWRILDETKVGD